MAGLVTDYLRMHRTYVGRGRCLNGEELHAALWTVARLVARDLGMHWAGVDDWALDRRGVHLHLRDEGKLLVRLRLDVGSDSFPLSDHVGIGAKDIELCGVRRLDRLV